MELALTTSPTRPLDGLRVVDLTDLRAALAGRLLADLGAEVVQVRSSILDRGDDTAAARRFRHANKAVESLDRQSDTGRRRLHDLLSSADVLFENLGGALRATLELEPAQVTQRYPALVHVALTDFGLSGPRANWVLEPLTALAASGAHFASGFPDMAPCAIRGYLAHDCGSVFAALAAVAGIAHRATTGVGQLMDISVQEAALSGLVPWSIPVADYARWQENLPVDGTRNAEGPHHVLEAADGYVRVMTSSASHWRGFRDLCRNPDALEDPIWRDPIFRRDHADVIKAIVRDRLRDRTRAELVDEAAACGATLGAIHRLPEFVEHPQIRSRRFFREVDGDLIAAAPFTIDGSRPPVAAGARGAPDWSSASPWSADHTARADVGAPLLAGVRVIEFGVAAVAPECSLMLSELGADVIKVESTARPDVLRLRGGSRPNASYTYNAECRGRRNVAIDLRSEAGRRLALELCAAADVVVENFRGGTMAKLGLSSADVRAVNPTVVYASSQGYGRDGPMGTTPAWGQLNLCFSAAHHLWNHPDAPYPCGTSVNHPDHIAGKWLALVVLAALEQRSRTGEGSDVELAQTEVAAFMMGELFVEISRSGADPQPVGNQSPNAYPHDLYATRDVDRWVAVACPDTASFLRLANVVGLPVEWSWHELDQRMRSRAAIDRTIGRWTSARTAEDAAAQLQRSGVSAMPVMGPQQHRVDQHLAARGFIVELDNPHVGTEHHVGNPIRPSALPLRVAGPAPAIGEHTFEVLTEVLGRTPDEVRRLVDDGTCR